jgi:lipid-A-disaccharide synthase
MKYYIIAGEASGDLHGSNLIKEIKNLDGQADIRCWGGNKMEAAGGKLVKHYRELAFMGFAEVLMNLRTIFRNLSFCKKDILQYNPDVLVLIDYPGFNLRIAKWARQQGLKVVFYISPQVWAWKESRVKGMKKHIDKMIVILPFEKKYFKEKWDWEVDYVGHPLIKEIERSGLRALGGPGKSEIENDHQELMPTQKIIALLPGSRKQEIQKKLPVMLEVSRFFPDYNFVIAKAPGLEESFYDELIKGYDHVSYVVNRTYELLARADAALVTSGTATLETALFRVPVVVCYKGSWLSYEIGRRLVNVKFIALVNLIMDREVVKELIQHNLTVENLKKELEKILFDEAVKSRIRKDYQELHDLLAAGGHASEKAAKIIVGFTSTI